MQQPKTPFELFHVECEDGWKSLIQPMFDYIENYNKDKNADKKIIVHQVKEKFGSLRFYTNFYTEELLEMIRNAEQESFHVCEFCGSKENVGHTCGWITTLCKDCAKKLAQKRDRQILWMDSNSIKVYFMPDGSEKEIKNEVDSK